MARTSVSTANMALLCKPLNQGKPYEEQIKPFSFLNIAFVDPTERPADEERLVLVAPYERDPRQWGQQTWVNRFNGHSYRTTTEPSHGLVRDGITTVKTYGQTTVDYATHPEPRAVPPLGSHAAGRRLGSSADDG